ncbi:hypothetical protein CDL15_Pgr002901 [Punica granatum]|uniref:Uncharacterized protein n=1 Tax=Punica granatum TaxID=22663 RepID=A0A218X251_PUNGR|nr:hypothetical protein CDL15_Pgr002901 [Punica granatum]
MPKIPRDFLIPRRDMSKDGSKRDFAARTPCTKQILALSTRCSPRRVVRLFPEFNEAKRAAVEEIGFGGLLQLPRTRLGRDLCRFIIDCYDPDRCMIVLLGRPKAVTLDEVNRVLGVNSTGPPVHPKGEVAELMKEIMKSPGKLHCSCLGRLLADPNQLADKKFKRIVVLFLIGTIFCTKSDINVPREYLHSVVDVSKIGAYNRAQLILDKLSEGARNYKKAKQTYMMCFAFFLMEYIRKTDP